MKIAKTLKKVIKERNGKTFHVSRLEELITKCLPILPKTVHRFDCDSNQDSMDFSYLEKTMLKFIYKHRSP